MLVFAACAAALATLPEAALGHAERASYYPNFDPVTKSFNDPFGAVPKYRRSGPSLVVCKKDSAKRLRRSFRRNRRTLRSRLAELRRCKFSSIQDAVDAARSGDRILVEPGVYKEEKSRRVPEPDPKCKDMYEEKGEEKVPNYDYQLNCPNAQNMIAVIGDGPDKDRRCDRKCNLQIEGRGKDARAVLISGERTKLNVIRGDRADGLYLRNFTVEYSDFNNIYVIETNGFVFDRIQSRYSREYGFLSFTSDHGLYTNLDAYGAGDSGIYPGAGPEGHCKRYGIEIRNSDSHHNNMGYSGTAGNGVYAHDNKFHHNATGLVTDSLVPNHPGMPQDCAKFEDNQFYSNNYDLFDDFHDEYCKQDPEKRSNPKIVCPSFQLPIGTGILIAGGNGNVIRDNFFYDNWRQGMMLLWIPTSLRGSDGTGQSAPTDNEYDTSNDNRTENNSMGLRPDGTRDPNGIDFWWDEEGKGNCWSGNKTPPGEAVKSDPAVLPGCPEGSAFSTGNGPKQATNVPCVTWDPKENTDPPGCDWFTRPPEPK